MRQTTGTRKSPDGSIVKGIWTSLDIMTPLWIGRVRSPVLWQAHRTRRFPLLGLVALRTSRSDFNPDWTENLHRAFCLYRVASGRVHEFVFVHQGEPCPDHPAGPRKWSIANHANCIFSHCDNPASGAPTATASPPDFGAMPSKSIRSCSVTAAGLCAPAPSQSASARSKRPDAPTPGCAS